jgi:hypothetical protein
MNMTTKEITKEIRENLKKEFSNNFKFSVSFKSYAGGASISIAVMQGNKKLLNDEVVQAGHYEINQYHIENSKELTEDGKALFLKIKEIVTKRHYDHSDSQTDYFDTNFYYHLSVGKWNKNYVLIEKEEPALLEGRLSTDPELKTMKSGYPICNFSLIAYIQSDLNNGTMVSKEIKITTYNKVAEACCQYLKKGSKIRARGKLFNGKMEAAELEFLASK